jgi:hypothetical protein
MYTITTTTGGIKYNTVTTAGTITDITQYYTLGIYSSNRTTWMYPDKVWF